MGIFEIYPKPYSIYLRWTIPDIVAVRRPVPVSKTSLSKAKVYLRKVGGSF